jgi:hypothetical protein
MPWTEANQTDFFAKIAEFWPQKAGPADTGRLKFFAKELEAFPIRSVLGALEVLVRKGGFFPKLPEIRAAIGESDQRTGGTTQTRRQVLIERLRHLSQRGAWYTSPKNVVCRIMDAGLELDRAGRFVVMPWCVLLDGDMELMVSKNESGIYSDVGDEMTWNEYRHSGYARRHMDELRAAGDTAAADFKAKLFAAERIEGEVLK